MTIELATPFPPAAALGSPYNFQFEASGGVPPYSYALISGSLPPGLTMLNDGSIKGTPSQIGVFQAMLEVSDSDAVVQQLVVSTKFTCLDIVTLADQTVDQEQFVAQLNDTLSVKNAWTTGITSQTSQTMIELVSAVGTFATSRILRVKEDAFAETAQSDSAILANTTAQGLRLGRKLPAGASVSMTAPVDTSIPPYTQFQGGGFTWFNSDQIVLRANVPITVILYEGQVKRVQVQGRGTNLQAWVSVEDQFVVSDQHVQVSINGTVLYKTFGGLWNYPQVTGSGTQQQAFSDRTDSEGRLLVMFGSQGYGAIPGVNDQVSIVYAITQGDAVNAAPLVGTEVTAVGYNGVLGEFASNPSGGASQRNPVAYKNFGAGTFGTFSSGVTKAQYRSIVNNYPGIVDTVTQAQREVNPTALAWMNTIRISGLTSSPWNAQQIQAYLAYCQSQTMYTPYFVWQDPSAILVDVDVAVYCFNSVPSTAAVKASVTAAIQKLFAPRSGLLLTNFYETDLTDTIKNAAPGQISYIVVNKPTQPMIVTSPQSPTPVFSIVHSGGYLAPGQYSYAISVNTPTPNINFKGLIEPSAYTNFPSAEAAGEYWIIRQDGNLRDPISGNLTPVQVGQQLLAISPGALESNFSVVSNPVGVIDVGSPTNFVFPQVTSSNSQVVLDWSSTPVANAIQYFVWGRVGGSIGILDLTTHDITSFVDDGQFIPTPMPISAYAQADVRYNKLRTLNVTVEFADRQVSATLPVRDTL